MNHTERDPEVGAGVFVVLVVLVLEVLLVELVLVTVFWILTLMMSDFTLPELSVASARSEWLPFAYFVVSIAHCMPSEGLVSVLSGVPSIEKATLVTLPLAFT